VESVGLEVQKPGDCSCWYRQVSTAPTIESRDRVAYSRF